MSFQSSDPFVPRDIGQAPKRMVRGLLFLPKSTARDRATPAVVMLHGSAGMIDDRAKYRASARIDGHRPRCWSKRPTDRPDLGTGFIERVLNITETMFVADAYAALAHLAARPEVDPRRVALAGFSYGGMATQHARCAQIADAFRAGWSALRGPCILLCTVYRPLCR